MNNLLIPRTLLMGAERERVEVEEAPASLQPVVYYYPAFGTWRLVHPFTFHDAGHDLHIPAPFDFDMASIPRILWVARASHELGILAPLYHDWLYRGGGNPNWGRIEPHRTFTRKEADQLFLYMMHREGVSEFWRRTAYGAVRAFGRGSWK
jgi:hypothetical protein